MIQVSLVIQGKLVILVEMEKKVKREGKERKGNKEHQQQLEEVSPTLDGDVLLVPHNQEHHWSTKG